MFDQARFLCQLSYKKKKKKTKTWVFSALGSLQWQVKDWGIIVIMLVSSGGNARMLSTALWWFPGGSGPWTGWATCGATREGELRPLVIMVSKLSPIPMCLSEKCEVETFMRIKSL